MDYERNEAVIRAIRKWKCGDITREALEYIFPELKESEDEKIRKDMIKTIKKEAHDFPLSVIAEKSHTWLAWLEKQGEQKPYGQREECIDCQFNYAGECKGICAMKRGEQKSTEEYNITGIGSKNAQGKLGEMIKNLKPVGKVLEQKPADKVEPKFHKGDWIIHQGTENIYQVVARIDNQYQLKYGDNYTIQYCEDIDRCTRLWDITKDAKDGDVLEFGDHGRLVVGIVSYINKTTGKVDVNCLLENNNFKVGNYYNLDTIKPHPATEERRELLFQKMKEAGYEWDAEKKELKKIEQKPTWSEEDEKMIDGIIEASIHHCYLNITDIEWLKSLKGRYTWKPSDEQTKALKSMIDIVNRAICFDTYSFRIVESLYEQLKTLCP